jgi:ABC-type transport system involved in multi-copper enzyme maturation permease subunit
MSSICAVAWVVIKEMYRRKDFYVLLIITMVITLSMASVHIFGDGKIIRYLKELCLLLIWVSSLVIATSTMARQIHAEKESRTIFPLLAKPISRAEVLLGKFLGCWLACGISLACFYVFFGIVTALRHDFHFVNYFQAATLHWMVLAIVLALTLLGSLIFTAPSSSGTICFILASGELMVGKHLNKVAMRLSEPGHSMFYSLYYAMPHLELFNVEELIIHDWPTIAWTKFAIAIAYGAVYTGLFLAASCVVFRRKALNK